jgi:alpha-galactosidase
MSRLLAAHPIRYIKWDHNRDLTTAGLLDGRPGYRAQVLAFYALLDRLRAAHPDVEIESCSGGGGRIDFAALRRAHRVWTSDCIDSVSRTSIQRGFLQFFPPEIMGAHVGTAPAHTTGRSQALAFRAAVALPGHLGVELDARTLDAAQNIELAAWIALYKRLRDRLHAGRVWLGEGQDGLLWQAHGDAGDLLLLVYRLAPSTHRYTPPLRLPMLDPAFQYRATEIRPDGIPATSHRAPLLDAIGGADGASFSGAWLAHAGLPVPRGQAETAWIVHLHKEIHHDGQ